MRVLSFVLITIIGAGYAFGREQTFPQQTFTLQEGKDSNLKIHAQGIFACTGDTVDPYKFTSESRTLALCASAWLAVTYHKDTNTLQIYWTDEWGNQAICSLDATIGSSCKPELVAAGAGQKGTSPTDLASKTHITSSSRSLAVAPQSTSTLSMTATTMSACKGPRK
ncbi:hypothetical protein E8E15_001430 [Penicillium rubens]|nr:hypothetical protein E8E15_001430 [Penicillium rubens]